MPFFKDFLGGTLTGLSQNIQKPQEDARELAQYKKKREFENELAQGTRKQNLQDSLLKSLALIGARGQAKGGGFDFNSEDLGGLIAGQEDILPFLLQNAFKRPAAAASPANRTGQPQSPFFVNRPPQQLQGQQRYSTFGKR